MQILYRLLIVLMLLGKATIAHSAPLNSYPKIEIDGRQVYSLSAFPYYDYFVCLRQGDSGMAVLEHLRRDPVFRHSLQRVAGEAAARQFRYLNELPAKRAFFSNDVNAESFPQKEQVPFEGGKTYDYNYQYLRQPKAAYQYDFETKGLYKEVFDRGSKRHWLLVGIDFLPRESDWKVTTLRDIPQLVMLVSLDMKQIQSAKSERDAYQQAQKSAELYFFKANGNHCQ